MKTISVPVERNGEPLPGSPFDCCLYRTRPVAVQTEATLATRNLDSLRVLSFCDASAPIEEGDVGLLPPCPETRNKPERVVLLHIRPYPTSLQCDFQSDALLSQMGLISRVTFGSVDGQIAPTYAPDAEPVSCRVDMFAKPRAIETGAQERVFMDGRILLPKTASVEIGDQIAVDSDGVTDLYDVIGHDAASQADALLLTVYVTKQVQ